MLLALQQLLLIFSHFLLLLIFFSFSSASAFAKAAALSSFSRLSFASAFAAASAFHGLFFLLLPVLQQVAQLRLSSSALQTLLLLFLSSAFAASRSASRCSALAFLSSSALPFFLLLIFELQFSLQVLFFSILFGFSFAFCSASSFCFELLFSSASCLSASIFAKALFFSQCFSSADSP